MPITPEQFRDMLDECRQEGLRVPNSVIIQALSDDRFTVRNVAIILADRRGLQMVNDRPTQTVTERG